MRQLFIGLTAMPAAEGPTPPRSRGLPSVPWQRRRLSLRRSALTSVLTTVSLLLGMAGLGVAAASPAQAAESTGTGISYTLEGCRASTDAYLPGTFVCPEENYTTGNLGKGWNEFDLVPGRVTLEAGNSAPTSQTFSFVYAVDNCSTQDGATTCTGFPGYDRLSALVLNTALSSGTCDATPTVSAPTYQAPGLGGTGTTLYRTVTIDGQAKGSTCVYDFYARLAFNSHLYPGSSLHFNLANTDLSPAGIGSKEVSIPVREILPPGFTKTQTSTQGSDVVWSVSKSSTPATVSFPQTCPPSVNPQSRAVTVTVSWTKTTTVGGAVTVTASIALQNTAHRAIDVQLSDQLYSGATPAPGNEVQAPKTTTITLPAGGSSTVTHIWSVTGSSATAYSDIATATFYDTVFQEALGSATRTASSNVVPLAPTSGATAVVSDVETMTGSPDFDFSVDSVSGTAGSFSDYPVLGARTRGPVTWSSGTVSNSGSTTFNKTVYVNGPTVGTATLSDTATLSPDGQGSTTASASSTVTGGATVSLVINKTMDLTFSTAKTFSFTATGTNGNGQTSGGSTTITIPAGSNGPVSGTISGLEPGVTYTVTEAATAPFPTQTFTRTITLPSCSATQAVENTAAPAAARVQKVTNPTGATSWSFTLTGGGLNETVTATANAGYVPFASNLEQDGATYTITETAQTGWDLTGVAGDFSSVASRVTTSTTSRTCSFTLNLTTDSGGLLSCTFTNTQRGSITIVKDAVPDDPQDFGYTTSGAGLSSFSLDDDADPTLSNTRTFTDLAPGSYAVTESLPVTGWDLTALQCSSTNGSSTTSTSVATGVAAITLGAGDSVTCTYTNTKRGQVTVVKTQNGGAPTIAYTFRLTGGPDSVSLTRTTDSNNAGNLDFGSLRPGTYTLCELAVPAGTHSTLEDQGGTVNPTTGDVCLTFVLAAGESRAFRIDNQLPGGGQRTIGYWRNWSSCSGTGKDRVAMAARTGNHLMDEFLPQTLGSWTVDTCQKGNAVLSSASAKYAENQLAAQLLAAKLNVAAGASTCTSVNNAIAHGDALLSGIGYDGPPNSTVGSNHPQRADFLSTANLLDRYNNGLVC